MECDKHENMIVLWGFSDGECIECSKGITTAHTPCNIVCEDCSEKLELCEICGEKIISK